MLEVNQHMQKLMIRVAMQKIASRRPGRSRLVYDRARRTIVMVSGVAGNETIQPTHIGLEDADMI